MRLADNSGRTISEDVMKASKYAPFLLMMSMGYAVYAIDRSVLPSVLAAMASSLALTNFQIGLLSSAQYIGVTCIVFLAGHISDRYGRWPVMLGGIVVFSAFTWLIAFASNFTLAFAFRLVSGFGEGAFWPVAMASVADFFRGRKGLALGIFYNGFDIGSVVGISIGGLSYTLSGDNWRPAFFYAPLAGVVVIGGALILRRRLGSVGSGNSAIKLGRHAFELLKKRNVVVIMMFALLATWASVWQNAFLPYYFFKVMHFTILSSALLSATVLVAGAFGKVIFGGFSDYVKRNRLLLISMCAVLTSYATFFASLGFLVDLTSALSMGFFNGSIFPVLQSLMVDSSQGKIGNALGLSTSSQSIATIFSPIIAASLFILGVGRALALDAMFPAALGICVALFLRETRRWPEAPEQTGEHFNF